MFTLNDVSPLGRGITYLIYCQLVGYDNVEDIPAIQNVLCLAGLGWYGCSGRPRSQRSASNSNRSGTNSYTSTIYKGAMIGSMRR
ncbi:hypothetical protein RSAG8_04656, partial [Rhizoctonia solani AG-8 WAC10335]